MGQQYRCAGDVHYDQGDPATGRGCKVYLGQDSQTWSFLQCTRALSPSQPSFSLQIIALGARSRVIVGIAGGDIEENTAPGHWNNTVGYHTDTGQCYSSHDSTSNTGGETLGLGDRITVKVSYFGRKCSTIVFLKNDSPVATRYLFASEHSQYLPCLFLENGPIELEVTWSETDQYRYNMQDVGHWIRPDHVTFDQSDNSFSYNKLDMEAFIQSPVPLSKDFPFYEAGIKEVSTEGVGPTIAITSSSPLKPTPVCSLLRDYLKWEPTVKIKPGDRIGWGVHYSPDKRTRPGFDDLAQQIILCYVVKDNVVQCFQMMVQPPGGFLPMVLLNQNASKVCISRGRSVKESLTQQLDQIYCDLLTDVRDMLETDAVNKRLTLPMLRLSESLLVDITEEECRVGLPTDSFGVHTVQFLQHLSPDHAYFYIELNKLAASISLVSVGVAGPNLSLSKQPGALTSSVGLSSLDGQLLHNNLSDGIMAGQTFAAGDKIGVEITHFSDLCAVVLFLKNNRPIGTRYLTEANSNKYLPTVSLNGNGEEVQVNIVWQTRVETGPSLNVMNPEHWCLPPGAEVELDKNIVSLNPDCETGRILQSPYPLHKGQNHYEIRLLDQFDEYQPPPVIALCSACPRDPPPVSHFQQDFIRFWATGKAASAVQMGDLIGWGVLFPEGKAASHRNGEDFVVCFLTINRTVVLTRVLLQPPAGFYPVLILPEGVNRVKLEFGASTIEEYPFTPTTVNTLLNDAQERMAVEDNITSGNKADIECVHKTESSGIVPADDDDIIVSPYSEHPQTSPSVLEGQSALDLDAQFKQRQNSASSFGSNVGKKSSQEKDDRNNKKHKGKSKKKGKGESAFGLDASPRSVGKGGGKKVNKSRSPSLQDEEIGDQYKSKSCNIL